MIRTNANKYSRMLMLALAMLLLLVSTAGFDPFSMEDPDVRKGNELFEKGKYDEAIKSYEEALKRLKKRGGKEWEEQRQVLFYNKGCALYKKGEFDKAGEELLKATTSRDKKIRHRAYYNLGNVAIKQALSGKKMTFDEALDKISTAIDFYKRALKIDYKDMDAKYNLEVALKIKEQIEKQKEEAKKKQQANNQQQNQQNQENKNQQSEQKKDQEKQGENQQEQKQAKNERDKQQQQEQQQKNQNQQQQNEQKQAQNQQKQGEQKNKQQQNQQNQEQQKMAGLQGQDKKKEEQKGKKGASGKAEKKKVKPLTEQEAEELLDALRENEKPLKLFLFKMQEKNGTEEQQQGGVYKSW